MKATLSTSLAPSIGGGFSICTRIGGEGFGSAFFFTSVFGVSTTAGPGIGSLEDADALGGLYWLQSAAGIGGVSPRCE